MVQLSKTARGLIVASLIWLSLCSAALASQPGPSGSQQVSLGWNASPDPTVVGYYLYYGTASGVYTDQIDVGTNITFTVTGLVPGSTNYFTTTWYNGARIESGYVPEVVYIVPGILTVTPNVSSATTCIQFPVAPSHTYQLQSSPDLKNWSNIWLTPTQTTNQWIEYERTSLPSDSIEILPVDP